MEIGLQSPTEVHFLLPGAVTSPVGGYKIVYEYANEMAKRGIPTHVWHSAMYRSETSAHPAREVLKSVVRASFRKQNNVDWHHFDSPVVKHLVAGYPRISSPPGAIFVGTAVLTFRHASRLAKQNDSVSVGFIQHYEDWSASPDYIESAWASPDRLVAIAPWLSKKCNEIGLETQLIPNAVDPQKFPLGPRLERRQKSVLSLLSEHQFKRPDLVVDTLNRIHNADESVTCRLFGQKPRPRELPNYIQYYENPTPAELCELYQAAQVYFCASDSEGWHLPPAEATLCGASVVSTCIDGVIASMADDAIYVPPGDSHQLALNVLSALSDVGAAQERTDRARSRLCGRTISSNTTEFLSYALASKSPALLKKDQIPPRSSSKLR
ncbi:glycosyltransferase, MSMEG_0565 family [Mycobacteroides abscessus subsp. abscessus]|nr:glycosyltransferase, MSMEG_0565 family [Mycobacteroides abscessus subsp. abscessus]